MSRPMSSDKHKYGNPRPRGVIIGDPIWEFLKAEAEARGVSIASQVAYIMEQAYGEAFRRFVSDNYPNCEGAVRPERPAEPTREDTLPSSLSSSTDYTVTEDTLTEPDRVYRSEETKGGEEVDTSLPRWPFCQGANS